MPCDDSKQGNPCCQQDILMARYLQGSPKCWRQTCGPDRKGRSKGYGLGSASEETCGIFRPSHSFRLCAFLLLRQRMRAVWKGDTKGVGSPTEVTPRLDAAGTAEYPRANESLPHGHPNIPFGMRGRRMPLGAGREEAGVLQFCPSCRAESDAGRTDFVPREASCSCMSRPSSSLWA